MILKNLRFSYIDTGDRRVSKGEGRVWCDSTAVVIITTFNSAVTAHVNKIQRSCRKCVEYPCMYVIYSLRPLDPFLPSGGEGRREGERGEGRGERGEGEGEGEGERGEGRGRGEKGGREGRMKEDLRERSCKYLYTHRDLEGDNNSISSFDNVL